MHPFCVLFDCHQPSKGILASHAKFAALQRTLWKPDSLIALMLLLALAEAQETIRSGYTFTK